jgi:hypothetical protein
MKPSFNEIAMKVITKIVDKETSNIDKAFRFV